MSRGVQRQIGLGGNYRVKIGFRWFRSFVPIDSLDRSLFLLRMMVRSGKGSQGWKVVM